MVKNRVLMQVVALAVFFAFITTVQASVEPCDQSLIDGLPPATTSYIYPRVPVVPFQFWDNNQGYCGEASMIVAGLAYGQWMSQYDARLICGTGLGQSGAPVTTNAYCSSNGYYPNFNVYALLEVPNTGVTGKHVFGSFPTCLANMRLASTYWPYQGVAAKQPAMGCTGTTASGANCPGYQQYMSWVKQQVINGNIVAVGVLLGDNTLAGDQYDHIADVVKIGTNHSVTDPIYYPDDEIFIMDEGVYWYNGTKATNLTTISPPPGSLGGPATGQTTECTPYVFGYTFAEMGASTVPTATEAAIAQHKYSIVLPANSAISWPTGFNGKESGPGSAGKITGPNDFAVAITGVLDTYGETVPVTLTAANAGQPGAIVGPTYQNNVVNPEDPLAGYDYEYPYIGTSTSGIGPASCTNTPPSHWMTNFGLQPTVSGLTPGVSYNLYEYQFETPYTTDSMGGDGTWAGTAQAALAVPVTAFNANSAPGGSTPYNMVTNFTASGSTYTAATLTTTSDQIVVYRAVPASPGLYSPANGSNLTSTSATFAWDSSSPGAGPDYGATAYQLNVGKEQGGNEYYQSGSLPATTFFQTVSSLPSDGSIVWARWSYLVSGTWQYKDYQYTAELVQQPQTITFTPPPPASAANNSNFTVAATATSGLAVTFSSSGSCTNSGATYTMTSGRGTCSVIANQAGNTYWQAAPTVTDTVRVKRFPLQRQSP